MKPPAYGTDEDDTHLLQAAGRGDRRAFAGLMAAHGAFALSLATRMTGNAADADEVVQEAFLRAWKMAPDWRPDSGARFRTWLYRVVLNLCLDRGRRAPFLPMEDVAEPEDPAPSELERLSGAEARRVVADLLAKLPERQRAALALCYLDDLTASQAAQVMGLSLSALEALLVRGRRGLRKGLAWRGFSRFDDIL
jgi:RNA polymerase sigma factor, sigma-70 family